jgi:hypothetical protein
MEIMTAWSLSPEAGRLATTSRKLNSPREHYENIDFGKKNEKEYNQVARRIDVATHRYIC